MAAEEFNTAEVVELCKGGDDGAWDLLIRRFARLVYLFLRARGFQHEDAEDSSQEAWIRVWRVLSQYNPAKGEFPAWLCRVAINEGKSIRRKRRLPVGPTGGGGFPAEDLIGDELPNAEMGELAAEMELNLKAALSSLDASEQFVIEGRLRHHMTLQACANQLGIATSTAHALYHNGLKKIRRFVIRTEFEGGPVSQQKASFEDEILKLSRAIDKLRVMWLPRGSVRSLVESISALRQAAAKVRLHDAGVTERKLNTRKLHMKPLDVLADLARQYQEAFLAHADRQLESARRRLEVGIDLDKLLVLSDFAAAMDLLVRQLKLLSQRESELAERFIISSEANQRDILRKELGSLASTIGHLQEIWLPQSSKERLTRAVAALHDAAASLGLRPAGIPEKLSVRESRRIPLAVLDNYAAVYKDRILACARDQRDAAARALDEISLDAVLVTHDMTVVLGKLIETIEPLDLRDLPQQLESAAAGVADVVVIEVAIKHKRKHALEDGTGRPPQVDASLELPESAFDDLCEAFFPVNRDVLLRRFHAVLLMPQSIEAVRRHMASTDSKPDSQPTILQGTRLIKEAMTILVSSSTNGSSRTKLVRQVERMSRFAVDTNGHL